MSSVETPTAAAVTKTVAARAAEPRPLPLGFAALLAVVLSAATLYGLFGTDPYRVSPGVRDTLPAVLRGQDLLTLLTIPLLVWSSARAAAGSLRAHLLNLGLLLYYAYSYVMYAFAPFNDAFLVYVAIIGLSGFALLNGLFRLDARAAAPAFAATPRRGVAWFFLIIGVAFIGAWLAMIVSVLPGGLPGGRMTYDIASAVHVLDLSFVLPLVVGTGVLLLRDHPVAPALATMLLCKIATLGLAMLFMGFVFLDTRSLFEMGTWAAITAVSFAWLVAGARRMRTVDRPWLKGSVW